MKETNVPCLPIILTFLLAVPPAGADDTVPAMDAGRRAMQSAPALDHVAGAGFASVDIEDPVGGDRMSGIVFYPSSQVSPSATRIGLHDVQASRGLAPAPGRWPLVVISHGQGGEQLGHHDLATHLSRGGFIVASITHPRDNYRDTSGVGTAEVLYGRPAQVQALVSHLLEDPSWAPLIDPDRIGAAGFSDGGYTVLVLAGAVPRFDRYVGYCGRHPGDRDTCDVIAGLPGGDDGLEGFRAHADQLHRSRTRWGETADARIKAVFAMAPTSVVFDEPGASTIDVPVFVYYSDKDSRLIPSEHALHLVPLVRSPTEIRKVEHADHWVFLAPCSTDLAREVPVICSDPPGVDRAAVHERILADALDFFRRALHPPWRY